VSLFVKKKDGRRELFDREKVVAGVRNACGKRPLPARAADDVADEVEAQLYGLGRAEVPSQVIGDLVMRRLKDRDHIAYIRFASIYREFADITALKEEIETLLDGQGQPSASAEQLPLLPDERLEALTDGPSGGVG
jgi:transcriptional repressor NrdR